MLNNNLSIGIDPLSVSPAGNSSSTYLSILRPFLKVELSASIVPKSSLDDGRWYRYSAGMALSSGEANSAVLVRMVDGKRQVLEGGISIIQAQASDGLEGQSASIRFPLSGLIEYLAPLVRPMDRLRLSLTLAGFPDWVVFDGLIGSVRGHRQAGSGWSSDLILTGSGIESILAGAVFNWQGFIHPASSLLLGASADTLIQAVGKSAKPPEDMIRAFIESAIRSAMGLRIGDPAHDDGLSVLDYIHFPLNTWEWSSWPGVAYPLPWNLIQGQTGASFWQIAQAISEPVLHELFVGYRPNPSPDSADSMSDKPTLIHRPRPFPGKDPKLDTYWHQLPVARVGGAYGFNIMGVDDSLSGVSHPNAFHWAGLGLGDHSKEAFQAKMFWGWAASDQLINRYGYSSVPVVSKLAPIAPGAPIKDYLDFAKSHLLHFAGQDAPLSLLRTRGLDSPFMPIRPGQVLEDHTLGSDSASIVTGYVAQTDFAIRASGDSVSMSMGANVIRCLRGTDAAGYPDAVRSLLPDLELKVYAGKDIGDPGPWPAVGSTFTPLSVKSVPKRALDPLVASTIKAAAVRQSIPPWFLAHILHNETGFGRFWGTTPTEKAEAMQKGMGQITSVALTDLMSIGYTNPDGTPFVSGDRRSVVKNIHATAAFLKRCQALIEAMPGGFPRTTGQSYYSWVARAYRWGAASTRAFGASTGWQWPAAGEPFDDYKRYWSPAGIESGRAAWGYLG